MKIEILRTRLRRLARAAAILAIISSTVISTIPAAQCRPVSTVQGQLLLMDCTTLGYNPDGTIRFTHRAACLARAKRDHHRLLFPAPDGFFQDIQFDLFVEKIPHRLKDLTPQSQHLLFHALERAALANSSVYIAVTGPFTPSDKSFSAQHVKILPAPSTALMTPPISSPRPHVPGDHSHTSFHPSPNGMVRRFAENETHSRREDHVLCRLPL